MRRIALLACCWTLACKDDAPKPESAAAVSEPEATTPKPDAGAPTPPEPPLEPLVRLDDTRDPPTPLPAFAPGTTRELVFEVRLREKTALHVPIVRVAADTTVIERGDDGSRLQWTPHRVSLPEIEGVDEAFLTTFEAGLAPADPPAAMALQADPWASVTALPWPESPTAHTLAVGGGVQLALSHLRVPTPPEGLSKGATWTVQRSLPVFGLPTWERYEAVAKKIDGDQLEVKAKVTFSPGDAPELPVEVFGVQATSVAGTASLNARFDLVAGLPVDMQLKGTLDVTDAQGNAKSIRFEVRADENYLAQPDERVTLTGKPTEGGLLIGKAPAGTTVWFNKSKLPVSEEGDFVFGFGRQAPPRALLAFSFDDGPPVRHILHVEARTFEPEAIDGLPDEFVHPDRQTRRELARSRRRIEKVRAKVSKDPHYKDGFLWPAKGKITSTYGRKRILNGEERGFHWGVDIASRVGKPVKAPAPGVVVFAEQDVPLSGNLVIIDHGHNVTSSFLHLQKIKVTVGDTVKKGQTIATLGNTGRSTGPHLDWRMNWNGERIDPQLLVPPR